MFLDLMCSTSAAVNPIWNETLQTPWLDGTVSDQVYWAYTTFPLPYHVHTYQVTQLVPYLQSICANDPSSCLMDAYKDYAFSQLDQVLSEVDVSQDAFITQWTTMVAAEFGLDQPTLASLYTSSDPYSTDYWTRAMWKYATSKGNNGTPTIWINGVPLDYIPGSVSEWLSTLQGVYDSQYR